jgi:hypothetical protein
VSLLFLLIIVILVTNSKLIHQAFLVIFFFHQHGLISSSLRQAQNGKRIPNHTLFNSRIQWGISRKTWHLVDFQ